MNEIEGIHSDGVSECCSAKVYNPGGDLIVMCTGCKEYCGIVDKNDEDAAIRERPWLMKM